jgi:TfoX/Sxy family transcriptional regulator of competence genes
MAYDLNLAGRIRRALRTTPNVTEQPLFGGLCFLHSGKMFCGIVKEDLMVRVGPEKYRAALERPHVRPMDFTGRPMKGYVFVEPAGCARTTDVKRWTAMSLAFVASLASSTPARRSKRAKNAASKRAARPGAARRPPPRRRAI